MGGCILCANTAEKLKNGEDFLPPKDYLACIAYMQQLIEQGEFELIAEESACPLEKVGTMDAWFSEFMTHRIRCKHCGQVFECSIVTYIGHGRFIKSK